VIRPPSLLMQQVKHIPGGGRAYIPAIYFWQRTSENSVNRKFNFAEFPFHALRCILWGSNSLPTARGKYVTDEARAQARTPALH
jgi:hypothetical protein